MSRINVDRTFTLQELIEAAKRHLPVEVWDYLVGGAETETSVKRNRQAIDSVALRPRVLTDVSSIDVKGELLGHPLRIPVLLPPIGSLQLFESGGGASVAKAVAEFGTMQILSSVCLPDIEEVAAASDAPKIYQLYLIDDEEWMFETIDRVVASGYVGFCLTVDTQVYSRRERDIIKGWIPPSGSTVGGNFEFQARMSWDLVKRYKDRYELPLVLKGIATAEDAGLAIEHGVDVVYVSNHGGRQLDHGPGTLEILPEIVEEVAGRAPVVVDGGFVRGTDVVKALALGATAVGTGRLECWAMAAGGAPAVVRMLHILEHEIRTCLGLLGVARLADLHPGLVQASQPVNEPTVTSAFPHLRI